MVKRFFIAKDKGGKVVSKWYSQQWRARNAAMLVPGAEVHVMKVTYHMLPGFENV